MAGSRRHTIGRKATRMNDAVELVGAHVAGCDVRLGRVAMAAGVGFVGLLAEQLHVHAGSAQPQRWDTRVQESSQLVAIRTAMRLPFSD